MKKGFLVTISVILSCIIALLGLNFCFGDFLKIKKVFKEEKTVQAEIISPYDIKLCFLPEGSDIKPATFGVDEDFIQFEYYAKNGKKVFSTADCSTGFYKSTTYDCFLTVNNEIVSEFEAQLSFTDDYIFSYTSFYPFDELTAPAYCDLRTNLVFTESSYFLSSSEHFLSFWATYEAQYSTMGPVSIVYWERSFETNVEEYFKTHYNGENIFKLSLSYYYHGEQCYDVFMFNLDDNYINNHEFLK